MSRNPRRQLERKAKSLPTKGTMTSAEQLYEAISTDLSESLCSLFEVVGVLELAKQELVLASFDDDSDEDEEEAGE